MGQPIPFASVETANISIGGHPRTIAVNPNTSRIYVADWFSNNLTVIDASSHSVIAVVALPADDDNGIAIDYNTDMIYVLLQGGVAEVNGSTNKVRGVATTQLRILGIQSLHPHHLRLLERDSHRRRRSNRLDCCEHLPGLWSN